MKSAFCFPILLLVPPAALSGSDIPAAPAEYRRPENFKPFHCQLTTEQLMARFSAGQMQRAEAEFAAMAKINDKGPWKPVWESLDRHAAPEWFLDAKLGIMLNWGLHSVPAWDLKREQGAMYPDAYGNQMYHSKEVTVNDRYAQGSRDHHGDYYCSEHNTTQSYQHPWEETQGIAQSFAYNWQDDDQRLGTATDLIHRFIRIVSDNGNLVIIGGPMASGRYPETVVARLKALGAWLRVNGEAIYATRVLPPYQEGRVSYTRSKNGKFAYAICKEWPGSQLTLKGVRAASNAAITLLGVEKPLVWRQGDEALVIDLPDTLQDLKARPCQHAWSVRIPMAAP